MGGLCTLTNAAQNQQCHTVLWPASLPADSAKFSAALGPAVREQLLDMAQAQRKRAPAPVAHTASAGSSDPNSTALKDTRAAFQDADRAAVFALAWRATAQAEWLNKLAEMLVAWSQVHQPSGHPIDETRLDALLWAYDLTRCALPAEQRHGIDAWLQRLLDAKRRWQFGDRTAHNNHRTHQEKMLLALERLLQPDAVAAEIAIIQAHQRINLAAVDGASLDYLERDALHYHVYDLEAWTEIELLSGCCMPALERSYGFLLKRLHDFPDAVEFAHSTAPIDRRRAEAGFAYAQQHPYDPRNSARVTIAFATLGSPLVPEEALNQAKAQANSSGDVWRLARMRLWRAKP